MDKQIKIGLDSFYAYLRNPEMANYSVDIQPKRGNLQNVRRITFVKIPVTADITNVYAIDRPFATDNDIVPMMDDILPQCCLCGIFHKEPEYFFADSGSIGTLYATIGASVPDEEAGEKQEYFVYSIVSLHKKMQAEFNKFICGDVELNPHDYRGRVVKKDIEDYLGRSDVKFMRDCTIGKNFLHKHASTELAFDPKISIAAHQSAADIHMYLTKREEWYKYRKSEVSRTDRKDIFLRYQDFLEMQRGLKALEALSKSDWRKQLRDVSSAITEEMTSVIVTVRKGNKTCKIHYPADFLRVAFIDDKDRNVYSFWNIFSNSVVEYEKAFGRTDFTTKDIVQITYKKKTIFKKAA